jgi:hypothetical protein
MTRKMVRYEVRPEAATHNEELIRGVFEELNDLALEDFRYEVFVLEDGVTVVHVVEHPDGANPLPELASFKRYSAEVRERLSGPPVFDELRVVGSTAG